MSKYDDWTIFFLAFEKWQICYKIFTKNKKKNPLKPIHMPNYIFLLLPNAKIWPQKRKKKRKEKKHKVTQSYHYSILLLFSTTIMVIMNLVGHPLWNLQKEDVWSSIPVPPMTPIVK